MPQWPKKKLYVKIYMIINKSIPTGLPESENGGVYESERDIYYTI